jgi:hypothetical protein
MEWLAWGLSIVPNGSKWPQHKKATIKWWLGDRAGQLKKLRHGNRRVAPAKRKKLWRGNQRIAPAKGKNAARKSMDYTGQKKKSQRGNQWIVPARRKKIAAQQSGYRAGLFKK